ncbi:MAG: hypothetical protein ACHQIG_04620 [Acidimicrobiia bacterium]
MPGRRSWSHRSAAWGTCLAVIGALALAGCSGSGSQYVKSTEDHTYFKVPSSWVLFGERKLISQDTQLSGEQKDKILKSSWRTAFDASPEPQVQHVFASNSAFPTGFAVVDKLSSDDADQVSDLVLRNQFVPVDKLVQSKQLDLLGYEAVNRSGGFHGIRFRARITSAPDSEVYAEGPAFTFEQISLVDQEHAKSYSLLVMCSSKCFESHTDRIEGVVDSWTVEKS